jgi:hypothetical protein
VGAAPSVRRRHGLRYRARPALENPVLTLLFATALLSSAPPAVPPRAPGPQLGPYAGAAPVGRSAGVPTAPGRSAGALLGAPGRGAEALAARPLPPDAPARMHLVRVQRWSAGAAGSVRSRLSTAGAAGSALFSLKGAPTRSLLPGVDPLTHAAAARGRLEDVRTQVLTSAGMGVAGLLTSGALRLLGAPVPRLPEVLGLRLAPLQTLPLSFSVQGSLP